MYARLAILGKSELSFRESSGRAELAMLRDELLAASAELEQRLRKPARAAPRRGLVLQRTRSSPSLGTTLHPEIGLAGSLAGAGLFRRHYLDRKNLCAGRALSMEQLPSSWSPGIAARAASVRPLTLAAPTSPRNSQTQEFPL